MSGEVKEKGKGGGREKVKKGDIVVLEYDAYTADDMELFDTTDKEKAKEKGKAENVGPITIIAGEGQVIKGLDEALIGSEVGKEKEIKISKEKAFGERDKGLIKTVSLAAFKKQRIMPYPGLIITYEDGMQAKVLAVSSGRVKLDFNHPLAGKDVVYKFKVTKIIKELKERTKALLDMLAKDVVGLDNIVVEEKDGKKVVNIKSEKLRGSSQIVEEYLKRYLRDVDEVKIVE